MPSFRQSNQIDLRTQGGVRTNTVTPSNSVQFIFDPQQARIGASGSSTGLYNCVRGIILQCNLTVVRSSAGTTAIHADQFARSLSSIGLTSPMFGTLIDPAITDGNIAQHILEWHGTGYRRPSVNRQPIPGTDGTYTRYFELYLPIGQGWNPNPDHFDMWLGWLDNSILEIFVSNAVSPFGISGATITNVAISAVLDMVPWPEIIIPPYVVLRKYEQAAGAGSNGPKLQNVGDAGALQGTDDGARLVAMLFSHQSAGFIGSGTADQIATVQLPWRDQAQTYFSGLMFERYLRTSKLTNLGLSTTAPTMTDFYDISEPYPMPGTASSLSSGALNDPTARYTPLVWPERDAKISQQQKVKGNYPLDGITFSSPQSNVFRVYTLELKQWSKTKVAEMLAAMGVNPNAVMLVPKYGMKNNRPIDPDKSWGFPRSVAPIAKKAA
jgi:hypothetical protein